MMSDWFKSRFIGLHQYGVLGNPHHPTPQNNAQTEFINEET